MDRRQTFQTSYSLNKAVGDDHSTSSHASEELPSDEELDRWVDWLTNDDDDFDDHTEVDWLWDHKNRIIDTSQWAQYDINTFPIQAYPPMVCFSI